MFEIKVLIIFCGMYYATPQWCRQQTPQHIKDTYEIHYLKYGTPLETIQNINYQKTAILGFSAGGLDVLKNFNHNWAFVGLIDPTTRSKHTNLNFDKRVYMMYNEKNWGNTNKSLIPVALSINKCGGIATKVSLNHPDIYKHFFDTYFKK
jgi:hypothetical protein